MSVIRPLENSSSTYPLVEIICTKLDCRIGHNADAIGAVTRHESPPAFFLPHLCKCLVDGQLVFITAHALYLVQNL